MSNSDLLVFSFLILGHVVGDFYLQSRFFVRLKRIKKYKLCPLFLHSLIHGLITFFVLIIFSKLTACNSFVFSFIVLISHFLIDYIKSSLKNSIKWFVIDQFFHLLVIAIIWVLVINKSISIDFLAKKKDLIKNDHVIIIISYLLVLKPASVVISMLLVRWNLIKNRVVTLRDAGQIIGYLERLLILTFIFLNQFSAIGFLLAAKSVFRFGELKEDRDKMMTEYVILGTLTSVAITIFIGVITTLLISI